MIIIKWHYVLLLFNCSLVAWSCSDNSESVEYKDSRTGEYVQLKGVSIIKDSIFRPADMDLVDSVLLIEELNIDFHYSIYNILNYNYIGQSIQTGDGPFEMISTDYLGKMNDYHWFYDMTKNKVAKFKFEYGKLKPYEEIQIDANEYRMVGPQLLSSTKIISSSFSNTKARIIQYDLMLDSFTVLFNFGISPKDHNTPDHIQNLAYHSLVEFNRNKSTIFLAGKNSDLIEIYNLASGMNSLFRTHGGVDPIYEIVNNINGTSMRWTKQMPFCYSSLTSNSEYVYCLYSGNKIEDGVYAHLGKEIYVYDWEGNLKQKFYLENPSNEIVITNMNELISLETIDDKEVIRKYTIPSFN